MTPPTIEDAIAAGDGTLHGAIDHWQAEADRLGAEVRRMRDRIERLRGMLKTNAGWWFDINDNDKGEICLEVAGDMEIPFMGSNVQLEGAEGGLPPKAPSRSEG